MKKHILLLKLIAILTLVFLTACSTVTIKSQGARKLLREPDYEDSKAYYLLGLVGEHAVDGKKVCKGKRPVQMQAQSTFLDRFYTVVSIGIYAPRTAKVWCPEKRS